MFRRSSACNAARRVARNVAAPAIAGPTRRRATKINMAPRRAKPKTPKGEPKNQTGARHNAYMMFTRGEGAPHAILLPTTTPKARKANRRRRWRHSSTEVHNENGDRMSPSLHENARSVMSGRGGRRAHGAPTLEYGAPRYGIYSAVCRARIRRANAMARYAFAFWRTLWR